MVEQSFLFSPLSSGYSKFLSIFDSSELEKVFDVQKSRPPSLTLPTFNYGEKAQIIDDFNNSLESGFLHLLDEKTASPLVKIENAVTIINNSNEEEIVEDQNRFWSVSLKTQGMNDKDIALFWKTRNQSYRTSIPDRMYSSLKYEIKVTLNALHISLPFVLARIYVLEENFEKRKEKNTLTGVVECAMSKEKNSYVGYLKVQMSHTLSFYHSKRAFLFQVRFFDPQEVEKEKHFASITSPPFKVYARKPNKVEKKKPSNNNAIKKKSSKDMSDFSLCLENLLKVNSKLNQDEKKVAFDMVMNKFKPQDINQGDFNEYFE